MNVQDIITLVIVIAAFGYAGYSLVKLILPVKSSSPAKCNGCAACIGKDNILKNIHSN